MELAINIETISARLYFATPAHPASKALSRSGRTLSIVSPFAGLAQDEECRCTGYKARSRRGGLAQGEMAMMKMLLSNVAALLLATGTAHADNETWEASFRQCHISKWFTKDELAAIGWARETEGQTIVIEAEEIPDILKAVGVNKKCKAFYQCLEDRDRGKVKHCYENDRRWR